MCLDKTHRFPKLSLKPIIVFKFGYDLYDKYYTPFQKTNFQCGSVIKSGTSLASFKGTLRRVIKGEGVHAYTFRPTVYRVFMDKVVHTRWFICVIPPLTPYWIGTYGEIAAVKIIVKRLIDL